VATAIAGGAGKDGGYDAPSLDRAMQESAGGWQVSLRGESLIRGQAEGVVLGGCLTMVEDTLGTPWELRTEGAILVLEDRAMKPFQVDRSLMHLKNAGKFEGVRGLIFGEFPDSLPLAPSVTTVREVVQRHTARLGVPVVWGAAFGHTNRAMLTLPLGVRARLETGSGTELFIQEAACTE
jgi:muramoyltetrapeptide carboxypeptidase